MAQDLMRHLRDKARLPTAEVKLAALPVRAAHRPTAIHANANASTNLNVTSLRAAARLRSYSFAPPLVVVGAWRVGSRWSARAWVSAKCRGGTGLFGVNSEVRLTHASQ